VTQTKCNVCGHQLADEDSVCNYCRYASDMNLEWVNYIQKKEEQDVQTKPKKFPTISWRRRSTPRDSQTSDTEDQD
jgi:hypothetical protein